MKMKIAVITLALLNILLLAFFWIGQTEKDVIEFDTAKVYEPVQSAEHRAYFETILFKVGSEDMFIDGYMFQSGLVEIDDVLYIVIPKSGIFTGTGLTSYQHERFVLKENKYTYHTRNGTLSFEKDASTYEYNGKNFEFSTLPIVSIDKYVSMSLPVDVISNVLNMQMTYDKNSGIILFSKNKPDDISKYEKYFNIPYIMAPLRFQKDYTDFEYQLTAKIVKNLLGADDRIARRFVSEIYSESSEPFDIAVTLKPTYIAHTREEEPQSIHYISEHLLSDGVIFMVDKDNPVESLTVEDLRNIYTGKITNWKEFGGLDQEIAAPAFSYRDEILMQVLGITEVRDFQKRDFMIRSNEKIANDYSGAMGKYEIMQSQQYGYPRGLPQTDIYDKSQGALNMSLYFYNKNNNMGYKILKINTIEANDETVATKAYPLILDYYLHINENTQNNKNVKMVTSLVQGEKGKQLLAKENYIKQ